MANPKGEVILINNQEVRLIPLGHCACGCGGKTTISKVTNIKGNRFKGQPMRFLRGHPLRLAEYLDRLNHPRGNKNGNWNGGRRYNTGYVEILLPDHPKANKAGYALEYILICEKVLGKPLPSGSQVHHANGIKDDNRNCNLVICQDYSYHKLIEQRTRAYKACGHANYLRCRYCKQYDDPQNLIVRKNRHNGIYGHHRECINAYNRRLSSRKKLIKSEAPCGGNDDV